VNENEEKMKAKMEKYETGCFQVFQAFIPYNS
jgi:hypothetical protein